MVRSNAFLTGTSANASSLSFYINSLVDNRLNLWLVSLFGYTPSNPRNLGSYVDLTSFICVLFITCKPRETKVSILFYLLRLRIFTTHLLAVMVIGVKESCFMNKIFTVINLAATLFIIGFGMPSINFKFWDIQSPRVI